MTDLFDFFQRDHVRCDELWAAVEAADEGSVAQALQPFQAAMIRHLSMEEEVLFPAFEQATGMMGGGPTAVMRMEHQQMLGLLDQMDGAAADGDLDGVLDLGDTLLMLIQQHNVKEEQVLYPMAAQVLGEGWAELARKLESYRPA